MLYGQNRNQSDFGYPKWKREAMWVSFCFLATFNFSSVAWLKNHKSGVASSSSVKDQA